MKTITSLKQIEQQKKKKHIRNKENWAKKNEVEFSTAPNPPVPSLPRDQVKGNDHLTKAFLPLTKKAPPGSSRSTFIPQEGRRGKCSTGLDARREIESTGKHAKNIEKKVK